MNAYKILNLEKISFFSLYDYHHVWVLRFSDDNTRFEVNPTILWLIIRKILGQNLSKDTIPMFYVVSEYLTEFVHCTEHRGWEWNTEYTHLWFMIIFCRSYPRERKRYPWIYFFIKIRLEMKFLRADLSSSLSTTKKIGVPVIMTHLLRLNQNQISVNFWRKKWRVW